jgi:hypothetical protein
MLQLHWRPPVPRKISAARHFLLLPVARTGARNPELSCRRNFVARAIVRADESLRDAPAADGAMPVVPLAAPPRLFTVAAAPLTN